MHEPLILAISFPLLRHELWRLKRTEWLSGWEDRLRDVFKSDFTRGWDSLRKLLGVALSLETMSAGMVRDVLNGQRGRPLPSAKT